MAKLIRVSDDGGLTYNSVPGPDGELTNNGEAIDDTVLGQTFNSEFTGLITWSINTTGYYKGVPGYCGKILKQGTPVATTGEAMSLVTGQTYQIDDATKELWDRTAPLTVFDDGADVTSEVETFDYLFGKITFNSSYVVTSPVTVDISYIPVIEFGRPQGFTLNQTAEIRDESDINATCANNGYRLSASGLRSVSVDFEGIYDVSADLIQDLEDRGEVLLEINPDNQKKSLCRGFFRITDVSQSGNVGENEIESITFSLSVPSSDFSPFGWQHEPDTTLPTAIIQVLDAWNAESELDAQYLPNGVGGAGGKQGKVIVNDVTLTNNIDGLPEFALSFTGNGALVDA